MSHFVLAFCLFATAVATPQEPPRQSPPSRRAVGYAKLVTVMVVTAIVTSYVGGRLPRFMAQFVGQLSTLGVYVVGAPIWEPMSSAFRKMAFDVNGEAGPVDDQLEALWRRTQREYSINEQMSRNVIASFLMTAKMNFYQAHAAYARDPAYAAAQIAEAAVRVRRYFADISPRDQAVTAAVRAAFTDHAPVDQGFREAVMRAIATLDPVTPDLGAAYGDLLEAWLSASEPALKIRVTCQRSAAWERA